MSLAADPGTHMRHSPTIALLSVLAASVLLACAADKPGGTGGAAGDAATMRLPFTISRETTRLTAPLRPNGTVDYVAAVRNKYRKGVTKDNNAAVLLLQAMDPQKVLDESYRADALKELGLSLNKKEKPDYFTRFSDFLAEHIEARSGLAPDTASKLKKTATEHYKQALQVPWDAEDFPLVARWLDSNQGPLKLIIQASKRSRFYIPLSPLPEEDSDEVLDETALWLAPPALGIPREAGRALAIRADLAVSEGRFSDARADLLASQRLGALVGQDPTLIGKLVGLAIMSPTNLATIGIIQSGRLSNEATRALLGQLQDLPPVPSVIDAFDEVERYFALHELQAYAQRPENMISMIRGFGAPRQLTAEQIDWDIVLKEVNNYCDRRVAVLRTKPRARRKAVREWGKEMERGMLKLSKTNGDASATEWVATCIVATFLPALTPTPDLAYAVATQRELARLAAALALYRGENRKYPDKLSKLSPKYIKDIGIDVFSGKAYVYKPAESGYVLYSVGMNLRDDGSVRSRDKTGDEAADDIVVKVGN